jgi:hypothetical protein
VTAPAATDRDILDALAPLLVQAWEHGGWIRDQAPTDDGLSLPADLTRRIRHEMWRARRAGLTHRQIALRARIPGREVIRWVEDPQERAEAYTAELHHLEREKANVRRDRARDARVQFEAGGKKIQLAALFGVSRPTLDEWLTD